MRFVQLIIIGLFLYLGVIFLTYLNMDDSIFITGEGLFYLVAFVLVLIIFLVNTDDINRPLIIVLTVYTFIMYLFAGLKLLLLPMNSDMWMMESYSWATSDEVSNWLQYTLICTITAGSGLLLGTKIVSTKSYNVPIESLYREDVKLSIGKLLFIYIVFMSITMYNLSKFGYGSISGTEADAIYNLYGIINPDIIIHISLIICASQWNRLSIYHRRILLFMILSYAAYRVIGGSRSSLYALLIPLSYYLVLFKRNFIVNKKIVITAIVLSIFLYPIAKGFKDMIHYTSGPDAVITFNHIKEIISISDIFQNFIDKKGEYFIEIIDRLSDMGAQLRIINDKQLVPVEEHINLIATFKRAINDMVPGDVFYDVLRTQDVFHFVYHGFIPIYGGEIYSLYGVYYVLFGYLGTLIVLFISSIVIGYLWKKLMLSRMYFKPIILGFYLITFELFLQNELIEGWFVNRVYRPVLGYIFIIFLLTFLSYLSAIFTVKSATIAKNSKG